MNATLVIMAAGLGTRYGGHKQIDGVGPNGEFLMEYAIHDAVKAGFDKVVFIIKPDMEALIRRMCGDFLEQTVLADGTVLRVSYAFQDFTSVPEFYPVAPERVKPFGTVHAVLCAEHLIHEPFCVINADDYYGAEAYRAIAGELERMPEEGKATMVAYRLKNTASVHGTVSRGICRVEGSSLAAVNETKRIQLREDGTLVDLERNVPLDPDAAVSMNFWGFAPSIFPLMREYFEAFLRSRPADDLTGECLLPVMMDELTRNKRLEVSVLESPSKWFGMTCREDRVSVTDALRQLHSAGVYPARLRQ